jgi:SNF2 family DNA or RNA helicase
MENKLVATPLQEADSDALLDFRTAYLWSEPGTGKTMVMLNAIKKAGISHIVIVAPPTALGMWEDQLLTQLGLSSFVLREDVEKRVTNTATPGTKAYENQAARIAAFQETLAGVKIFITSFKMAVTNYEFFKAFLLRKPTIEESLCIIDEAHYCKSHTSQRTVALLGEPKRLDIPEWQSRRIPKEVLDKMAQELAATKGFAHYADLVWQATGTPRTRWADDLWSQLYFGRKAVLAKHGALTLQQFITKFCFVKSIRVPNSRHSREVIAGDKNQRLMLDLLRDCGVIRRTLEEAAAELPPLTSRLIRVPSIIKTPELTDDEIARGIKKKDSPLAEQYKKIGMAKVPDAIEILLDTYNGPLLVGFWHTDVGKALCAALRKEKPEWTVVMADGSTLSEERDLIRQRFNAGQIDVLVGQMEALSTSMNLQEIAKRVLMVEQLPSPATWQQFYQRVYRKGQRGHVQLDEILATNSLDQALRRIRLRKAAGTEATIGQLGES